MQEILRQIRTAKAGTFELLKNRFEEALAPCCTGCRKKIAQTGEPIRNIANKEPGDLVYYSITRMENCVEVIESILFAPAPQFVVFCDPCITQGLFQTFYEREKPLNIRLQIPDNFLDKPEKGDEK